MTALETRTADQQLATVLREDGLVTAAVGGLAVAVTALDPDRFWGPSLATWLPYAVGAALLAVGVDLLAASRWTGRRLRRAATVTAELAAVWVLASVVLLVTVDLPTTGAVLVGAVAVLTAGFGLAYAAVLRH